MAKKALICGISGQDGSLLAKKLLKLGYDVVGTSRDAQVASFSNLERLGVARDVRVKSMVLTDFRSVFQCLSSERPDEVYNLAGQSSVGLSFEQPVETLESVALGTLNLLEAIRFVGAPTRIYNACSSECFGNTPVPADELTPFRPRSPYAVAKSTAFWEVANYREAYGIYSCSGILFNHESPLRPARFVTKKIVAAACRIAGGSKEKLRVGNIDIRRDWGWAPEFVDGMHLMLQQKSAEDFVLATGKVHSLKDFLAETFRCVNLNWQDHVESDPSLFRPLDLEVSQGNPQKAATQLGWKPKVSFSEMVSRMVESERSGRWDL